MDEVDIWSACRAVSIMSSGVSQFVITFTIKASDAKEFLIENKVDCSGQCIRSEKPKVLPSDNMDSLDFRCHQGKQSNSISLLNLILSVQLEPAFHKQRVAIMKGLNREFAWAKGTLRT